LEDSIWFASQNNALSGYSGDDFDDVPSDVSEASDSDVDDYFPLNDSAEALSPGGDGTDFDELYSEDGLHNDDGFGLADGLDARASDADIVVGE
jgi:hypothetical protein